MSTSFASAFYFPIQSLTKDQLLQLEHNLENPGPIVEREPMRRDMGLEEILAEKVRRNGS